MGWVTEAYPRDSELNDLCSLLIPIFKCSPGGIVVKNPPASTRDTVDAGSIPGLGKFFEKERATLSSILDWKIP